MNQDVNMEIAEMIARYKYNAKIDADRIKALEEYIGKLMSDSAPKWQPIETAPKDPWIIVCCQYTDDGVRFQKLTYWSDAEKGWDGLATSIRNGTIKVTHWMPMNKLPPA
jgi:hypothetical protein